MSSVTYWKKLKLLKMLGHVRFERWIQEKGWKNLDEAYEELAIGLKRHKSKAHFSEMNMHEVLQTLTFLDLELKKK